MDFLNKNAGAIGAAALLVGLVVLIMASVALSKAGKVQKAFDSAVDNVTPEVNQAISNVLAADVTLGGNVIVQGALTGRGAASFAKGVAVTGDATVSGAVTAQDVTGTRDVTGQQGLLGKGQLVIDGKATLRNNLDVGGTTTTGALVNKAAK